jgi:predicted transcriptional regulator of viral defense system
MDSYFRYAKANVHSPRVPELVKRDHGVLTTHELLARGLTRAGIHQAAKTGRLHRLHHGVYAVGHAALSREGQWLAARVATTIRQLLRA